MASSTMTLEHLADSALRSTTLTPPPKICWGQEFLGNLWALQEKQENEEGAG